MTWTTWRFLCALTQHVQTVLQWLGNSMYSMTHWRELVGQLHACGLLMNKVMSTLPLSSPALVWYPKDHTEVNSPCPISSWVQGTGFKVNVSQSPKFCDLDQFSTWKDLLQTALKSPHRAADRLAGGILVSKYKDVGCTFSGKLKLIPFQVRLGHLRHLPQTNY